jgi:hypothetical protein
MCIVPECFDGFEPTVFGQDLGCVEGNLSIPKGARPVDKNMSETKDRFIPTL